MDKWILSKLNTLIKVVDNGLNDYDIFASARALQDFTDDLSNWYVRRGRERFWAHEMTEDKISAYMTLYTVLTTMAKLSAPFTPFIAESIYQNLQTIKLLLNDNNISDNLYEVLDSLKKLKLLKPSYLQFFNDVESSYYVIEELGTFVKNELNGLEFDEERLNEINDRLSIITRLKRKYHQDIEGILKLKEEFEKQIDSVDNFEFFEKELNTKVLKSYELLKNKSMELTNLRKAKSENLKNNILRTLKELMLEKVKLQFVFNEVKYTDYLDNSIFNKDGVDKCDILISFNLGEDLKPLSKVASGGEMSRVMLALKSHLFINKDLSTVIFDEIDTGMSGAVAEVVAKKLKEMSEKMQVFSITHLPIVASNADQHLYVKKNFIDDKTTTCVVELSFDEKVDVLSEMISPNDTTGKAREVAKLMLLKNK